MRPSNSLLVDYEVLNDFLIYRKGLIYFPEFCQLILKWFRDNKEEKENFNQNMFKVRNAFYES